MEHLKKRYSTTKSGTAGKRAAALVPWRRRLINRAWCCGVDIDRNLGAAATRCCNGDVVINRACRGGLAPLHTSITTVVRSSSITEEYCRAGTAEHVVCSSINAGGESLSMHQ